ncbi:hypothetical protein BH09PAT1_BH09PAT1_1900 [soil metagenome]
MKSFRKYYFPTLLAVILFLGFFLRFYQLGHVPNGLYPDETALGYNAYSILLTGKDEYGVHMPLYFRSFDDYKLPVYVYATVLTEKIFGVNAFAVRLPSAVMGSLSLVAIFLLVYFLSRNKWLALLSTATLSVNPWHLFFSRAGYEVNVATALMLFGTLFFVLAVQKKTKYVFFILSIISFLLAVYTYNVTRLISPILFAGLCLTYYKELKHYPKTKIISLLMLFAIGLLPFIVTFFSLQSQSGFAAHDDALLIGKVAKTDYIQTRSYFTSMPSIVQKLLFNNLFLIFFAYLKNLVSFFSTGFFFITGADRPNENVGGNLGMFYYFDFPFIIYGAYQIIKQRTKSLYPFIVWFLIIYFIGSIIKTTPNGTRTYAVVIPFTVFAAYGIYTAFTNISKYRKTIIRNSVIILSGGFIVYSIVFYLLSYFIRFPIEMAQDWRSEDQRTVAYIQSVEGNYDKIVFDNSAGFYYTSLLFYSKIDPTFHQTHAAYSLHGLVNGVDKDGRYEFKKVDWDKELTSQKTLFITGGTNIPGNVSVLKTITYPTRPVVLFYNRQIAQYPTTDTAYTIFQASQTKMDER